MTIPKMPIPNGMMARKLGAPVPAVNPAIPQAVPTKIVKKQTATTFPQLLSDVTMPVSPSLSFSILHKICVSSGLLPCI